MRDVVIENGNTKPTRAEMDHHFAARARAERLVDEISSLELLADMEADFDNAKKAARLRGQAKKLRAQLATPIAAGECPCADCRAVIASARADAEMRIAMDHVCGVCAGHGCAECRRDR